MKGTYTNIASFVSNLIYAEPGGVYVINHRVLKEIKAVLQRPICNIGKQVEHKSNRLSDSLMTQVADTFLVYYLFSSFKFSVD